MVEPTKQDLEAFIRRAGFTYGWENLESWARRMAERAVTELQRVPRDMVLYCPACGVQHIDNPEPATPARHYDELPGGMAENQPWRNPPHRSHLCHSCGFVWRPCDTPTNGVAAVKTKGQNDAPVVRQAVVADVVAEVVGCFRAAMDEGLADALAETTDERLKDLVERRLMHAYHAAEGASVVGLGQRDLPASANVDQRVAVAAPQAQEVATPLVYLGRDGGEHHLQPAGSALPHGEAPVVAGQGSVVVLPEDDGGQQAKPKVTAVIHESDLDSVHATLSAPRLTEYTLEATREEGKDWYITVTAENGMRDYLGFWRDSAHRTVAEVLVEAARGANLGILCPSTGQPRLKVWLTCFPESNGKTNWTALLVREDRTWGGLIGNCGGITIDRGEHWNRVAYEAERTKFLLGLRDTEPDILDYGDDIATPSEWKGEVRGGRPAKGGAA